MALSLEQIEFFRQNGFLVVENFFSSMECDHLRARAFQIVSEADMSQHPTVVFSTKSKEQSSHAKSEYFLNSGDKIRFFFEEAAVGEDGQLKVEPSQAINKIGHALHAFEPDFRKLTFSDRVKYVAKSLDMKRPCVVQSMVIFKPPKIGGVVTPHQDSTFLYTSPMNLLGFWIALEDAEIENGGMWFAPGSHKEGISGRFKRTLTEEGVLTTKFEGESPNLKPEAYVATPVRKGTLVLIHGEVVHKSGANLSNRSRNIYTFHLYDTGTSVWSEDNWLQPTEELPFPYLY